MAMQFYASPEQIMRDRSEYARKGITRGRTVVVMSYADGVLFVAENVSKALHKVSEIYDRIGFAAVGRYNEFENLRAAGVRMADLRGYSYDRRDVTGRAIATAFAQTLGSIFTEQSKPFEVEICIAEVGASRRPTSSTGSPTTARHRTSRVSWRWAGRPRPIRVLRKSHRLDMSLTEAVRLAVQALGSVGGEGGNARPRSEAAGGRGPGPRRPGRKFRRITGTALTPLLDVVTPAVEPRYGTRVGETGEDRRQGTRRLRPTPTPSRLRPSRQRPSRQRPGRQRPSRRHQAGSDTAGEASGTQESNTQESSEETPDS